MSHLREKIEDDPSLPALRPDRPGCRLPVRRALTWTGAARPGRPRAPGAAPHRAPPGRRPRAGAAPVGRARAAAAVPRSFQSRLTVAFVAVVALTLGARRAGPHQPPGRRASASRRSRASVSTPMRRPWSSSGSSRTTVGADAVVAKRSTARCQLNPEVARPAQGSRPPPAGGERCRPGGRDGDVRRCATRTTDGVLVPSPDPSLSFSATFTGTPDRSQARDPAIAPATQPSRPARTRSSRGASSVTLSNPYTSRASTLAAITGLLLVMALVARRRRGPRGVVRRAPVRHARRRG